MFLLSIFYLVGENCRFTYWFIIEASYLDSTINWTGFYLLDRADKPYFSHTWCATIFSFVLVIGLGIIAVYLSPLLAVGLFILPLTLIALKYTLGWVVLFGIAYFAYRMIKTHSFYHLFFKAKKQQNNYWRRFYETNSTCGFIYKTTLHSM